MAAAFNESQPDFEPLVLTLSGGEKIPDRLTPSAELTLWPQDLGGNAQAGTGKKK